MKLLASSFTVIFLIAGCSKVPKELFQYKIVYNARVDSTDSEVFMVDVDGENKTNLTSCEAFDEVLFYLDNLVYFESDRESQYFPSLYSLNPLNGATTKEIDGIGSGVNGNFPIMGDMIVYSVMPSHGGSSLHSLSLSSGYGGQLTKNPNIDFSAPALSPDKRRIVFCNCNRWSSQINLWTSTIYGDQLKQLTFYSDSTRYHLERPYWTKANQVLYIFSTYTSSSKGEFPYLIKGAIFSVSIDDGVIQQVTPPDLHVDSFSVSPDEKWIVFSDLNRENKKSQLFLQNIESKKIIQITNDEQIKSGPIFIELKTEG